MSRYASEVTKDQLIKEFDSVVAETEQLLKSVATGGGEKVSALHASIEQSLSKAKDRLRSYQQAGVDKTRAAARSTDVYVHEHPWQAIGFAAGVNVLIGLAIGLLLLNRR